MKVNIKYTIEGSYTIDEDTIKEILNVEELPETLSDDQLSEIVEIEEENNGNEVASDQLAEGSSKITYTATQD